jgi:hypothetical protein
MVRCFANKVASESEVAEPSVRAADLMLRSNKSGTYSEHSSEESRIASRCRYHFSGHK